MRSPAISPWLNGTTMAKGTAKVLPPGDAKPLAPAGSAQRSPDGGDVVADGRALVLRSPIGERAEELLLVCCSDSVPAGASQPEWHRLEGAVGNERLEAANDLFVSLLRQAWRLMDREDQQYEVRSGPDSSSLESGPTCAGRFPLAALAAERRRFTEVERLD